MTQFFFSSMYSFRFPARYNNKSNKDTSTTSAIVEPRRRHFPSISTYKPIGRQDRRQDLSSGILDPVGNTERRAGSIQQGRRTVGPPSPKRDGATVSKLGPRPRFRVVGRAPRLSFPQVFVFKHWLCPPRAVSTLRPPTRDDGDTEKKTYFVPRQSLDPLGAHIFAPLGWAWIGVCVRFARHYTGCFMLYWVCRRMRCFHLTRSSPRLFLRR